ncbi:unnamed protein product, partial [Discosporangium mesarthrocarpum]
SCYVCLQGKLSSARECEKRGYISFKDWETLRCLQILPPTFSFKWMINTLSTECTQYSSHERQRRCRKRGITHSNQHRKLRCCPNSRTPFHYSFTEIIPGETAPPCTTWE